MTWMETDGFIEANDCDDFNSNVNPWCFRNSGNGIDDNCNGLVDEITATTELSNLTVIISPNPAKRFYGPIKTWVDRIEMYNSMVLRWEPTQQMIDVLALRVYLIYDPGSNYCQKVCNEKDGT